MKFDFGIFGINCSSGVSFTKRNPWKADWEKIKKTIIYADKNNYKFVIPISSWMNYGGFSKPHKIVHDTFVLAAALSQLTKNIAFYHTVHVPFISPIFAAKIASTIDSICQNRTGINLVCGWNKQIHEMFGLKNFNNFQENRYDYAKDWINIFKGVSFGKNSFSYKGKFLKTKNADLYPKINKNKFDIISAAYSESGRNFAINYCNIIFSTFFDVNKTKIHNKILKIRSNNIQKKLKIYTPIHVICRRTRD